MDGKVQTSYPRKNWSSCMLFNRERKLTPELINRQTGTCADLWRTEADRVEPSWKPI